MTVDRKGNAFQNIVDSVLVDSTTTISQLKEMIQQACGEKLKEFKSSVLRLYVYTSIGKMSSNFKHALCSPHVEEIKRRICIETETDVTTVAELSRLIELPNISNLILVVVPVFTNVVWFHILGADWNPYDEYIKDQIIHVSVIEKNSTICDFCEAVRTYFNNDITGPLEVYRDKTSAPIDLNIKLSDLGIKFPNKSAPLYVIVLDRKPSPAKNIGNFLSYFMR